MTITARGEGHPVGSGEEIALWRSSSGVERSNGETVTVVPKTVIRNHGLLSVFIREEDA